MKNIEKDPTTPSVPHKPEISPLPQPSVNPPLPEIKPGRDPQPSQHPEEVPVAPRNRI